MEVLKNLMMGLLAGDIGLWALLVIFALVVWVMVDAVFLARGMPEGFCGRAHEHSTSFDWESDDIRIPGMGSSFGGAWGHGTNRDGTSRM